MIALLPIGVLLIAWAVREYRRGEGSVNSLVAWIFLVGCYLGFVAATVVWTW